MSIFGQLKSYDPPKVVNSRKFSVEELNLIHSACINYVGYFVVDIILRDGSESSYRIHDGAHVTYPFNSDLDMSRCLLLTMSTHEYRILLQPSEDYIIADDLHTTPIFYHQQRNWYSEHSPKHKTVLFRRSFRKEELDLIKEYALTSSTKGEAVAIYLKDGRKILIPMSSCPVSSWGRVDLSRVKILKISHPDFGEQVVLTGSTYLSTHMNGYIEEQYYDDIILWESHNFIFEDDSLQHNPAIPL